MQREYQIDRETNKLKQKYLTSEISKCAQSGLGSELFFFLGGGSTKFIILVRGGIPLNSHRTPNCPASSMSDQSCVGGKCSNPGDRRLKSIPALLESNFL